MSEVVLFAIEYAIDGSSFSAKLPARDWKHAEELAKSIGAKVCGTNVHEISSIPAAQLMDFCSAVADEPIRWKVNAEEQLESFLSIGWPAEPEKYA